MEGKQKEQPGKNPPMNTNLDYQLLFNLVAQSTSERTIVLDTEGRIIFINASTAAYLKRKPEAFLNKRIADFLSEEEAAPINLFFQQVIQNRKTSRNEFSATIMGEKRWFQVTTEPVLNGEDQVIALLILAEDITQKKEAQQELAGAQAFHQALFNHAQEAIIIIGDDGKPLDLNPASIKMFGFNEEDISANDDRLVRIFPNSLLINKIMELVRDQGFARGELELNRKNGEKFVFSFYAVGNIMPSRHLVVGRDITRQKKIEQELIESEERYRSLFEVAQEAILIVDDDLQLIDFNPHMEKMLGYTREELFQASVDQFAPYFNQNSLKDLLTSSGSQQVSKGEYKIQDRNGKTLDIDYIIIPNFIPNLHLILMQDITEHKRAVDALSENRARLSTLINNTDGIIWSMDTDYRLIIGNSGFNKFSEERKREPVSTGDSMLANERTDNQRALWKNLYDRALEGEQFSVEMPQTIANTVRIMELRFSPIHNTEGKITGLTVFGRDTTERKQAEVELRESEGKFRLIAERVREVFWVGAPDWSKIHYINPFYEEIWGRSCQSLYNNPYSWMESIHEDDRQTILDAVQQKVEEKLIDPEFPEYRIVRPDGEIRWILARAYPVHDEHGNVIQVAGIAEDITGRKRAEEALLDSELRYRALFNSATDAIFIMEEDIFITCNPATVRIFGCTEEAEILSHSPWDFSPKIQPDGQESKQKAAALIQKALDGTPQNFYWKHIKANGTPFDAEVSLNDITINEKIYVQAIVRDVTERKKAEEALQESEARYSSLVNVSPNAILIIQDQKYVFANPAAAEILGYEDPKDVIGLSVMETVTSRYRQAVAEREERAIAGQKTDFALIEIQQPNGGNRYVETFSIPYKFRERMASLVIGIDVTEKLTQENMLSGFYKAAPLGVGVVIGRQIIQANEMFCQMTGYSLQELLHQDSRILYFNNEDYLKVGSEKDQQMNEIGVATTESRFRRKDGSAIDVLISSVPIDRNDWSKGINTVVLDISERKQAEQMVQNLNEELEERVRLRTQQLEKKTVELESFSYSISHDLRAPLRAINGLSQILLDDFAENWPQDPQDLLTNIISASRKMDRLIDGLLMLSRLGQKRFSPIATNISQMASQVFASLSDQTQGREITFKARPMPQVWADPQLLETALTNLISNAVKFTRPRNHAVIEFGMRQESNTPVFYLRDNGVGFNLKYADKLFVPFQRLQSEEDFEGTGVGLTIVKRIVERHKGDIWFESEEGKGTTFFFTLNAKPSTNLPDEFSE